ncbi:MAG: DUF883 family protein [Rhizobiaceae bacterium]|nr:DUF883 family protein [Rhizobiaceae bacterium]
MATTSKGAGTKSEAGPASGSIEADVAELRAEIAALTRQLAALGEKSVNTAKRAAAEGVEQLRSQGEAKLGELRASASDFEARVTETVREKPVTSLAIAAGIGFLFALIARR